MSLIRKFFSSCPGPRRGAAVLAGAVAAVVTFAAAGADAAPAKREVPDYDGRDGEPTTPGDVAIWAPRIALSPLYIVSEYVVRRPLGALITAAERADVPKVLYDFFAFGPDHKAGFAPTLLLDFGFKPSVGIFLFWDDAFFKGHDLNIHASTWTSEWIAAALVERFRFHGRDSLTLTVGGIRRPDLLFAGTGARSLDQNDSRYGADRIEASALLNIHGWRASSIQVSSAIRSVSFYDGHYSGEPNITQAVAAGLFSQPTAFTTGYTAQIERIVATLDTRRARPAPGSGFLLEGEIEEGSDVRHAPGAGWLKYGGTAAVFGDLNDHNRVVSLAATALFADPLAGEPVPFTELVAMGGTGPLRGFLPGRLYGRSGAALVARYRWPVWDFIDGSIQAGVGNVFDEHLQDLKPKLLRFSSAIGVETVGSPDSSLEILFGIGSETFDQGGTIDSIRFVVGSNRGF